MSVQLSYKEGVLTARLSGEIDHHSAREMREAIDDTAQKVKPACLRLDFSQVPFMDSSGIGLVLGRVRLLLNAAGPGRVVQVPAKLPWWWLSANYYLRESFAVVNDQVVRPLLA